ncbi:ATP-dependent protease [Vibrio panuliri]|uniref:endopeptidase La n=1 Tax=Vibrio panuliri TaxID=1381081 RepID=A0A1Q9HFC1_9VIBR|nr:Lon protease family protein [Vibrio panuliri]OLQ88416.1 ATP-dependent protease [Vibrio panuliri]
MIQEQWQAVTPQYNEYDNYIDAINTLPCVDFASAQPRLSQTIDTFTSLKGFNHLLVLNAPDNAFYREHIAQVVKSKTSHPVLSTESIAMATLFGSYRCDIEGNIAQRNKGLLERCQNGFIIIPVNALLANPASWLMLKAALLTGNGTAINAEPRNLPVEEPVYPVSSKLLLVGDRDQIAELEYLEPDLYNGFALYSEVELELALSQQSIETYLGHLNWMLQTNQLPPLTPEAVHRLMVAGARLTEDQRYMPLDIMWYLAIFFESLSTSNSQELTEFDIDAAIDAKYYREAYLPERARSDILDGQVIIETQGECVGQVNGLTVIDVSGHPQSYGEPARISCVIHFGDGDISDVERKAELGGNLHAKGMMIMQAFVASALNLDEPLPYSASVVFEQSYCEVDGDSATLAELCSFVSALSEYPINQQIAVTGAVDQFGRVQAVGGLNEKIEGFYHVCKHQGFTGNQGVILPKTNLKHLALHKDVVNSIKNNEFHIWSVETVDQAIPIIMGKPFRGDDEESVISKIAQRIENFERHEQSETWIERIRNWFN